MQYTEVQSSLNHIVLNQEWSMRRLLLHMIVIKIVALKKIALAVPVIQFQWDGQYFLNILLQNWTLIFLLSDK